MRFIVLAPGWVDNSGAVASRWVFSISWSGVYGLQSLESLSDGAMCIHSDAIFSASQNS